MSKLELTQNGYQVWVKPLSTPWYLIPGYTSLQNKWYQHREELGPSPGSCIEWGKPIPWASQNTVLCLWHACYNEIPKQTGLAVTGDWGWGWGIGYRAATGGCSWWWSYTGLDVGVLYRDSIKSLHYGKWGKGIWDLCIIEQVYIINNINYLQHLGEKASSIRVFHTNRRPRVD